MRRPIRMFWSGRRTNWINYGDCIGPALVEILSSRKVVYAGIGACQLIAAGSILERYAKNRWRRNLALNFTPLKVWGSGSMHSQLAQPGGLGRVRIGSVRGKGTITKYSLPAQTPMGDPGILAHLLLRRESIPKTAKWGIIPHLVDITEKSIRRLVDCTPAARLIDLSNPDLHAVTESIAGCEYIASSSLHGLIAADSLGVPNFRLVASDGVVGGSWKFEDYASALGGRDLRSRKVDSSLDLCEMEKHLDFSYRAEVENLKVVVLDAFRKLDL